MLDRLLPISPLRLWRHRRISLDRLTRQVESLLSAWGATPEHVSPTARLILYADLRGIDSHGVGMMPAYQRDRLSGVVSMTPQIEVVRETDTTGLIDAGSGLGHVPSVQAMELAIAKARTAGIGAVGVCNSGHFGAAGAYAELAATEGFIGIATTNTRGPVMVPTGGAAPILGTNPIAFAAPGGERPPFVLDMATSTVPIGRVVTAWKEGRSIPAGWASTASGRPTRNARLAALGRRLTPLGGTRVMGSHKGYGLAAMVEILTSTLTGVSFPRPTSEPPGQIGHFFLALDPDRFLPLAEFRADMDVLTDALHSVPATDPRKPVLVPGDPERAAQEVRLREGIPLSRSLFEDLRSLAIASDVAFVLEDT